MSSRLTIELSDADVDRIAARVAELIGPQEAVSPYLSAKEAALYLACPVSRIHDLVGLGRLPALREGRRLLLLRTDLDALLQPHSSAA